MGNEDDARFENCPVDRRQFMRLSAAAGGTLLLPGATTAQEEIRSEKFTTIYEFVVNHTPRTQPVQTLVRLNDPSGFQQLQDLGVSVRTTRSPELAAYLEPSPKQVKKLVEIGPVREVLFSPGANPFWRLQKYDDRVFPAVTDSVGFIDFEEMVQGMKHLADQHPNRLQLKSIGKSAGRYNILRHEIEPKKIWVAELTNDVTDVDSFAQKEKVLVFNQDSDERQGPEAMFRFVEDLLAGDEPEVERHLDDLALVFMVSNPDGWVSKYPYYYSGQEVQKKNVLIDNQYRTDLATGADPNRSYPTAGYMDPENYPAEAMGANLTDDEPGVDSDVPARIADAVPGELEITEYLRTRDYENLNYGLDLHGFGASETFIEGFPLNGDYDYADLQDLYSLQRSIDAAIQNTDLKQRITSQSLQQTFERLNKQMAEEGEEKPPVPKQTYKYGTLFDILGYSTSGDCISWMSAAVENGGLGDIKTYATETVYSIGEFIPELTEAWVVANSTVIRATAKHAAKDVQTGIDTGGASTAYVVSDGLTRSSDELSFNEPDSGGETAYDVTARTATLAAGGTERLSVTADDATRQLVVSAPEAAGVRLELVSPAGDTVNSRRFADYSTGFGSTIPKVTGAVQTSGDWEVRVTNLRDSAREVDITVGALQSDGGSPNPEDVLGFEQRDYTVSPFAFFREHESYLSDDAGMEALTVGDVQNGALMRDGEPAFENVVVIHRDGRGSSGYVSALDEYVDKGGNLVLTDQGVHLLSALGNQFAKPFGTDDISDHSLFTSFLGKRTDDHPLLAGTASSQLEVGKWVPLGYSIGSDAPMTLVDPKTFEQAGGSVAATTAGQYKEIEPGVSAGSITPSDSRAGIHVIGGLLPPATQRHLHPFGMSDYSLSHLGVLLLTNALGYEANVSTKGE